MNIFEKSVEFTAYQFDPSKITSEFGEGSVSHLIKVALGEQNVDIYEATVENGKLTLIVTVLEQDAPRQMFRLNAGDWIVAERFGYYTAYMDDEFWEFATPVSAR